VKQPFFSLKLLFKEMEIFKQMNPDMISCIYEMHKATPEKVIDCLQSFAENHQESNIMSWLIRYIRNCTHEHLLEFIRYVTGSTSLPTGTLIAVKYVDQPIDSRFFFCHVNTPPTVPFPKVLKFLCTAIRIVGFYMTVINIFEHF